MPHMLLVMEPVEQRAAQPLAQGKVLYDRMVAFGEKLASCGILKACDSLAPTTKGVRVAVSPGERKSGIWTAAGIPPLCSGCQAAQQMLL